MEVKATVNGSMTLLEIQKDGKPVGRPSLYPGGTELTTLRVPKPFKEQLQQIGIALAWGDAEGARKLLE